MAVGGDSALRITKKRAAAGGVWLAQVHRRPGHQPWREVSKAVAEPRKTPRGATVLFSAVGAADRQIRTPVAVQYMAAAEGGVETASLPSTRPLHQVGLLFLAGPVAMETVP